MTHTGVSDSIAMHCYRSLALSPALTLLPVKIILNEFSKPANTDV